MLPKEHRLTSSRDHRAAMRHGSRAGGSGLMVSVLPRPDDAAVDHRSWRCGLVVSKAVGNAVVRHRVQRRLRHIVMDLMRQEALEPVSGHSLDIVIRAFPEITALDHPQLRAEVLGAAQRAQRKSLRRAART
ncbi:ribonuclease P protein component [Nesterenkonia sp. LB17]|uniref:ribonuclease P protein component n=1 Tax=unclassified Nesterenkonia TaxID=2629769 RepID=UPI001F4D1ED4|nr:ribonuclease P protein component [Nesterenkonia sp. DZ6]MCH8563488.1 ribonuclease P protein component [Nesterenkonia sp. YGD6]MCH8566138.1 ribonuclease P protein component [Nesterenkonia sp. LB17]